MKKRIFALVLSLALLLALLPTAALADDVKYDVHLGEVQVTDANRADILKDGTASYNPATRTLTLDGYDGAAIASASDLNIILAPNSLSRINSSEITGIHATGDIAISGSGSLIVSVDGNYGVYAEDSSITLAIDGSLEVYANDDIRVCGITCDGSISITGTGRLYVEARSEGSFSNGIWAKTAITVGITEADTLSLGIDSTTEGDTEYACGMYCNDGDISIGGRVKAEIFANNPNPEPHNEAYGVYLYSKGKALKISSLGLCQRIGGDTMAVYNAADENSPVEYADQSRYNFFGSANGIVFGIITSFADVPKGSYYESAVDFALLNEITTGTSATTFSPNKPCTRAQAVTFLWRACGCPELTEPLLLPFTDVSADSYYYDAVAWALSEGITAGTSATTFSPNTPCTRGQIVTFLWRAAGEPSAAGSNPFTDVKSSAFYYRPVLWAVAYGITTGTSATTFSPDKSCTRAQIVTFLWRVLGETALYISSEPMDQTFTEDLEKLTIRVGVMGGTPPYSYKWYYLEAGDTAPFLITEEDSEWVSGWNTDTLINTIWADTDNGSKIFCVITDAKGYSVTSRTMTITKKI